MTRDTGCSYSMVSDVATFDLVDASWRDVEWSGETLAEQDKLWSAALVVRKNQPVALPDGQRVVRLVPDWGRDWPLRESFTDHYTLAAQDLHLSQHLSADLHDWNGAWQNRNETDPLPRGWIERGRHLRLPALNH